MFLDPVVGRISNNRQKPGSAFRAPTEAPESLKSVYVGILYNIAGILITAGDPTSQVICSVQMREEELFKAPPVICRQFIGPPLAHIILARDRFYAEATISIVSV